MKHLIFISSLFAVLFFACTKPSGKPDNPDNDDPTIVMKNAIVSGVVLDIAGHPIVGVNVSTGSNSVVTGESGAFSFTAIATVDNRILLNFDKPGYFKLTRSHDFQSEIREIVTMREKGNSDKTLSANFSASMAKNLAVSGMKVNIPASSLKKTDGSSYSGNVTADMFYLSPDDENLAKVMPGGDLAAVRTDKSEAMLISYGMTEVSLTDAAGNPLQLKDGEKAELSFPIPDNLASNPPATIPLWSFNEKTGLWEEEGIATLQNGVYVGQVSHFSWHNLDDPASRVTVIGRVVDCNGNPVGGDYVSAEQTGIVASNNGTFSLTIPANYPLTINVLSQSVYVPGQPGNTIYNVGDITVPCRPQVCVTIANTCGSSNVGFVWIEGSNFSTLAQGANGQICINVPIDASGDAWLWCDVPGGGKVGEKITLTGSNQSVNLNICTEGGSTNSGSGSATITPTSGGNPPIVIPANKIMMAILDSAAGQMTLTVSDSSQSNLDMFVINVENYDGGNSQFATVTYTKINMATYSMTMFNAENVALILSEIDENGFITVSFSGSGSIIDVMGGGTEIPANISGSFTVTAIEMLVNVPWAESEIPANVPQLFDPIDKFYRVKENAYKGFNLGYANRAQADYEEIKSRFAAAGYNNTLPENTYGGETTIEYQKGTVAVKIDYSSYGVTLFDNDPTYTIAVQIYTTGSKKLRIKN